MIKITNTINTIVVTNGAYKNIYYNQGYRPVVEQVTPEGYESKILTSDEEFVVDILEKPISSWIKEEVKRFAEIHDIDLKGTKNVNEAKVLIKAFIENNIETEKLEGVE